MANTRLPPRKIKPRKSQPRKLSVDQVVDRQLKTDRRNLAESQQRIDILGEYFNQTVKFSRAIWNFLLNDMNYSPGVLDNPERCNHLVLAHEKLHSAAICIRYAKATLRQA